MTKRMTAMARIERVVEKFAPDTKACAGFLWKEDAIYLILAERARLKRKVRKLKQRNRKRYEAPGQDIDDVMTYAKALDDILALWEQ